MPYNIDKGQVERICTGAIREFGQGNFNHGELLVGLSEAIGRIIVDSCTNLVSMSDCVNVVHDHLRRTIAAGAKAKGFNMGDDNARQ